MFNDGVDSPILTISDGLIDTNILFKRFEEIDQHITVDFDEDGMIPKYIEFDRSNESLYYTIEEILTVYINQRDNNKIHDDKNTSEFSVEFPVEMFREGTFKKCVLDVVKWFDESGKTDIESNNIYNKLIEFLYKTNQEYIKILNNNMLFDTIKTLHIERLCVIETTMINIKQRKMDLFTDEIDNIYNYMINNIKDNIEYRSFISNNISRFKTDGLNYINNRINLITDSIIEIIRYEYYKACNLYKFTNINR